MGASEMIDSANTLADGVLELDDGRRMRVPEAPFLLRPGATGALVIKMLDRDFRGTATLLVLDSTGLLYTHRPARAEWERFQALPAVIRDGTVASLGPPPLKTRAVAGNNDGVGVILEAQAVVLTQPFFDTLATAETLAGGRVFSDAATLRFRAVVSADSPFLAQPAASERARAPTAYEMHQNLLPATGLYHLQRRQLMLENGLLVGIPTISEYDPDFADVAYFEMLGDLFEPMRDDAGNRVVVGVFPGMTVNFLHLSDDEWSNIAEDPLAASEATMVVRGAAAPRLVAPVGADGHAVAAFDLEVRIDGGGGALPAAARQMSEAGARRKRATLVFQVRLRSARAGGRRVVFSAPVFYPASEQRRKPFQILPVPSPLACSTLEEGVTRIENAWLRLPALFDELQREVAAAYISPGYVHMLAMRDGERVPVDPLLFYALLSQVHPIRDMDGAWVFPGWVQHIHTVTESAVVLDEPVGRIETFESTREVEQYDVPFAFVDSAPRTESVSAAAARLREAWYAQIGGMLGVHRHLACGFQTSKHYHVLISETGQRVLVDPLVFYPLFDMPRATPRPFVRIGAGWIRHDFLDGIQMRPGYVVSVRAPVGELRMRRWNQGAGKRLRGETAFQ
jgi:hypothetical protein